MTQTAICQNRRKKARPRPKRFNLFIMKLTATVLLTACLQIAVAANGVAQVTLACKNESVANVLNVISKQTDYSVFYTNEVLKHAKPVTLSVKNTSVEEVLRLITKDQPFDFQIREKDIFIVKRKNSHTSKQSFTTDNEEISSLPDIDTIDVRGRIINDKNEPVASATIIVKGGTKGTSTDSDGRFYLRAVPANAVLVVSAVNIEKKEIPVNGKSDLENVSVKISIAQVDEVIVYNTGFENIPKERATGSFTRVDNNLLNRSVSTNILERLQGVASGLLYNGTASDERKNISIRGISTIHADAQPLIVIDNFPYDGDIDNINVNDIESVVVLKDAAAASIWGARAGNGVIVINTKRGRLGKKTAVSINSNITFSGKPDLFVAPNMSVNDYIEVERFLFDKGYYNSQISNTSSRPALSPVVEILLQLRNGEISSEQAETAINELKTYDVRNDYKKYLFRKTAFVQRHALNLSGGGANNSYYFSIGFDRNLGTYIGDEFRRITTNINNTYISDNKKLKITTGLLYSHTRTIDNSLVPQFASSSTLYPYARLADSEGNPLPIDRYRKGYIDTAGGGLLLDWTYRPLEELGLQDDKKDVNDYRINFGINYSLFSDFSVELKYQYGKGTSREENNQSVEQFSTRDYINQFTSIDRQTGNVIRPIPPAGIVDFSDGNYEVHFFRVQGNFDRDWQNELHRIVAIAGFDINQTLTNNREGRYYGYDPLHATSIPVDYVNNYTHFISNRSIKITNRDGFTELTDRNVSYFLNASYTLNRKYVLSISARKDASNLFGVRSNQQGVPLWSAGFAWDMSKESFFQIPWLSELRFRSTYGYNGNVDKRVTAYLVARTAGRNVYGVTQSSILNPPNENLRWEKIGIANFALEFATKNKRIEGSVEHFQKYGQDLLGDAPLPPSSGLTEFRGNTANIRGKGIDVVINTLNIDRTLKWRTIFLFSHAKDWVTTYKVQHPNISSYTLGSPPMVSKPVSAIYSYKWGGLDPATGDPIGYVNKTQSQNYADIVNSTDFNDIVYHGPGTPTYFGSLRNTITWKQFSCSFNITYKLGYYFRRTSIEYRNLFSRSSIGHSDFEKRWQKAGDEAFTDVPSMIYPANANRDQFYQYSEVLVEKGNHVRLQDIQLNYDHDFSHQKSILKTLRFYAYATNLGIIWRSNNLGIDPDHSGLFRPGYNGMPTVRISFGIKADF